MSEGAFCDLEKLRLEIIKEKLDDAVQEFKTNKGQQQANISLTLPLINTLLEIINE